MITHNTGHPGYLVLWREWKSSIVVHSSVTASSVHTTKMKTYRNIPFAKCFDYNCHDRQNHHHHQATRCSCTHYEGIWVNGDIIPLIPKPSSKWTLVVSFLYQLLETQRNCLFVPTEQRAGWVPQQDCTLLRKEKFPALSGNQIMIPLL